MAGRLPCAIDIKDEEVVPFSVPQPARLFLAPQRTGQQIVQKQGTQGLDGGLIKCGEKAAECGAMRQSLASEERHEHACPGLKPLVKGLQGPFGTDGIAEQHRAKIDDVVPSEAPTGKAHLILKNSKHPLALQVVSQQRDFAQPRRRRGHRVR